jgi:hypothetical protein
MSQQQKLIDISAVLSEAGLMETRLLREARIKSTASAAEVQRIGRRDYLTDSKFRPIYTVMDYDTCESLVRQRNALAFASLFLGATLVLLAFKHKK